MIEFNGSSQSQGGDAQDDPIQEMIRQALAASKGQPGGQPAATADSMASPAANASQDPQTFGERIGAKTTAAPPRPSAQEPEPIRVVTQPRPTIAPPGATGVLVPPARDSAARPSFGQQIGAKSPVAAIQPSQPQAPSPSSVAPFSAPPAAATDKFGGTSSESMRPVLSAPVGSNNPKLVDLLAQQAKAGKTIDKNAVDPNTGKPMYKMGWGQRLVGTLANFASGFGGKGGDPIYVGPGATNRRYQDAEDTQQKTLKDLATQITGQEKLDTTNLNYEKEAQRQTYQESIAKSRGETAEANLGRAQAAQDTADVKQQLADLKAQQGPAEPKTEAEIALAYQMAVMKRDPKAAVYKGALAELAKQKQAGRAPKDTTAGDIAKALQVSEFRMRQQVELDKAKEGKRTKRYAELDKNEFDPDKIAAKKVQVDQELETEYAPKAQAINDQADQMLGLTKSGAKLTSGNAPAKTPPKPTTAAAPGKIWVFEKATGRRGQIPKSQLNEATQGKNAQYGTF